MGRRKKDDDTFWLVLGLFGAGWLACKAAKALFSLPKIPNPPQERLKNANDCEIFEFVLGIILMGIVLFFLSILDIFSPCMLLAPIIFFVFFIYRFCKRKKKAKKAIKICHACMLYALIKRFCFVEYCEKTQKI